jgi:glycosyltransferase involved in cell wall biosynthesis
MLVERLDAISFKLLLLSDAAAPHTRRWANWFAEQGVEVHVATFNQIVDPGYKNVNIHFLWNHRSKKGSLSRFKKSIVIALQLKKLLKKLEPDVIHSHSIGSYSWIAFLLNVRPRIVTPWGTDLIVDMKASNINHLLSKFSLITANHVTTDAKYFEKILVNLGVSKEKLSYVPFGSNFKVFKPKEANRNNKSLTVISTRTLNPVHCVEDLISAIPEIIKRRPDCNFKIVGGGSQRDVFIRQIENMQLMEKVDFTGMLNEFELSICLQESDIYISTSMHDAGLAASTAEAMACALPVIHPDVADNKLWVDSSGGALYQINNISELVDSVVELIDSKEKRIAAGKMNLDKIRSNYDLNKNMNFMFEIYKSFASK